MDETKYAKAFELIMNAGNAKSLALMAVESAREFDFEEAQKQLKESQQEFHLAHQAQSDMIQGEANGNPVELNIVLVHAQDHLMDAMVVKDMAVEFVELYRTMAQQK